MNGCQCTHSAYRKVFGVLQRDGFLEVYAEALVDDFELNVRVRLMAGLHFGDECNRLAENAHDTLYRSTETLRCAVAEIREVTGNDTAQVVVGCRRVTRSLERVASACRKSDTQLLSVVFVGGRSGAEANEEALHGRESQKVSVVVRSVDCV